MASRREFLQAGVAASILPLATGLRFKPSISAAGDESLSIELYTVIFDRRFPASLAFASEMKRRGAPVQGIDGDITNLWFNDLDVRWRKGPAAIAGLTADGPLFCLERLAWDHLMRVVFRAEHRRLPDGRLEHVLWGPATMLRHAVALSAGGAGWPSGLANLVTLVTRGTRGRSQPSTKILSSSAGAAGEDTERLVSWVIAPS